MHRLNLLDRRFVLVEAPVLTQYRRILAYHRELLCEARKKPRYYLAESDWILYPQLRQFYQAIADQLDPAFNCDDLEPLDRHSFFIATAPVTNPFNPEEKIPGLSNLEKLMGLSYPEPPKPGQSPYQQIIISSGDPTLDILADALLVLKEAALPLAAQFSPADLLKITKQANDRLRGEEAIKEVQQQADRAVFEGQRGAIAEALKASGVEIPEGF